MCTAVLTPPSDSSKTSQLCWCRFEVVRALYTVSKAVRAPHAVEMVKQVHGFSSTYITSSLQPTILKEGIQPIRELAEHWREIFHVGVCLGRSVGSWQLQACHTLVHVSLEAVLRHFGFAVHAKVDEGWHVIVCNGRGGRVFICFFRKQPQTVEKM